MGTSVNQGSPNTGGWKAVAACYTSNSIPIERVAVEIWRAAFNQDQSIPQQLETTAVAECIKSGEGMLTREAASQKIQGITALKQNTIVGEFAKRALMIKAGGGFANESVAAILFRQLTDYLVSRDIPGFVGPSFRCKTVSDVRDFKEKLNDVVARKVQAVERIAPETNWSGTFPVILEGLRQL